MELYEDRVREWRQAHEKWCVADSLWRDSVGRELIPPPPASEGPVRPMRPMPPEPGPVFSDLDEAALEVYEWVNEAGRWVKRRFRVPS